MPFDMRYADKALVDPLAKELAKADQALPQSLRQRLRAAFTVRGLPFFEFYIRLRRFEIGEPVPADIRQQFRRVVNRLVQIKSPVDKRTLSPMVVNQIADARIILNILMGRLVQGRTEDPMTWMKLNQVMVPLMVEVAKDKGVYLKAIQRGRERWATFRRMSPKQEKIEKLKDEDPESYALMVRRGEALEEIDAGIRERIISGGMIPRKARIMGRPILLGTDPSTGEERVFDREGDVLTVDEYLIKRREQAEWREKGFRAPPRMEVPLRDVRQFSDAELETLEGNIEYDAITDDKAKQSRLTRIFATKRKSVMVAQADGSLRVEKVKVIVSGRFKGIYLDDMINSQGRMIEGTAYTLELASGRKSKIPLRRDVGDREPYVTVANVKTTYTEEDGSSQTVKEDKLFLKIPGTREFTEIRNAVKMLACNTGSPVGCIPSISYHRVQGSRAATFYFDPKDYKAVRDAVQGMSLSKGALTLLDTYFEDLSRAEQATAEENLRFYDAEALGGFKVVKKDRSTDEISKFDLLTKQKQAIAWLDAKGNNGVCSLDTGVGKTLTCIATVQKLRRDGFMDEGASYRTPSGKTIRTNGRFLYVTPGDLKGNLPKEIRAFLSSPGDLLDALDIVSYHEFRQAVKGTLPGSVKNKQFWQQRAALPQSRLAAEGKVWDIQLYTAIFFDEAQKLTLTSGGNVTSLVTPTLGFQAANTFHPRKIFLTASPMEKEPEQAYMLQAMAANETLAGNSPPAVANRKKMKRFMERLTVRVGGRIVGVQDDPALRDELQQWVKQAIFFADKREVKEFDLPDTREETLTVTMQPIVEDVYRAATQSFSTMLGAVANKMRDRGEATGEARDPELDAKFFGRSLRPLMKILNGLANYPAETLRHLAELNYAGVKHHAPILRMLLQSIPMNGDELMAAADKQEVAGNPKLQQAESSIEAKLDATNGSSRALIFSDDKKLCMLAGEHLSRKLPGMHVVATNTMITILKDGSPIEQVEFDLEWEPVLRMFRSDEEQAKAAWEAAGGRSRIPVPFRKKAYRRYPDLPAHRLYNTHYKADQWQQFVLKEVVSPNRMMRTCTLLGSTYQFGHNLQAFDQVIHLDRNSWNSENMKQRTARSWRQGQDQPVDVTTIDAVYSEQPDHEDQDPTLDQIRRWFQEMEGDLFDAIIKESQNVELGTEWLNMTQQAASFKRVDREVLELMSSPYVSRSKTP